MLVDDDKRSATPYRRWVLHAISGFDMDVTTYVTRYSSARDGGCLSWFVCNLPSGRFIGAASPHTCSSLRHMHIQGLPLLLSKDVCFMYQLLGQWLLRGLL